MSDCFEHFDYTDDRTGLTYRVEKHYDTYTHPLDMDECIVMEEFDWDVCDDDAVAEYIDTCHPDLREVAVLRRMRPLTSKRLAYRVFDSTATESRLIRDGVDSTVAVSVADKLYEWFRGWLDDRWHYVTLWVLPLDEHGEPIKGEHAHCVSGVESTEEDWNEYIEDLIDEVFWSQRRETHKGQLELNFN